MKRLISLMILFMLVMTIPSGCQKEFTETSVASCRDTEPQAIKAAVDYFEDGRFEVVFEWMCQPNVNPIRIELGNISETDHIAFLQCETSCRGESAVADLTHFYTNRKEYYAEQNSIEAPVSEITYTDPSEIAYLIDFSKIPTCPYYTEPAISSGVFLEHSVSWKEVKLICSGRLKNLEEKLFFRICTEDF